MKDGFVQTTHGRIHYLEEGSGRPIVLLQSNGNSAFEFEYVIPPLSGKYRVIAWDQPGQGDSDPIGRHYSVEDYGDAVIAFMDALGLDKAAVLGSSIGGSICIDLGARYPDRMDRLFIMEAPIRKPEEWESGWLNTEKMWTGVTQTFEQVAPRLRALTDEMLVRWNIDRNKAGAWCMVDVMWALRLYDAHTAVRRIATEHTMAVYGAKSQHAKTAAVLLEKTVPGCKLTLMDDCGHFPMLDDPEELARVVDGFMGG